MKYKIVSINKGAARKKILSLGLLPNTIVEVIRVAPLGDPMDIKVRGYHISIRENEWKMLTVEPIECCNKGCCD
jgi:Fe2+ transport system protein FeoA